jgi:hypothetical protein
MNLILVAKKWVEIIGNAADLIVIERDLPGDYAIVMASDKNLNISGAFVEADVCRQPASLSNEGDAFSRVRIPVGMIAAIFDFSRADAKKIAFATVALQK